MDVVGWVGMSAPMSLPILLIQPRIVVAKTSGMDLHHQAIVEAHAAISVSIWARNNSFSWRKALRQHLADNASPREVQVSRCRSWMAMVGGGGIPAP